MKSLEISYSNLDTKQVFNLSYCEVTPKSQDILEVF